MSSSPFSFFPHTLSSPPPPQQRRQRQPPKPRRDETLFRILCNTSSTGAIIGPAGAFVNQLRLETGGTQIHCCDPIPRCKERVVIIVGDKAVSRTMKLVNYGNEEEEDVVVFKVSCAQEALLRVVARVIEIEGGGFWCRLVVDGSEVGKVLGRGGRNLERIARESGARIELRDSPSFAGAGGCGLSCDQIIMITGDVLAMNRALHAVSCCLQDCLPEGNLGLLLSQPAETDYELFPNHPLELFPQLNTSIPRHIGYAVEHALSGHSVSLNTNAVARQSKKKEVVFRLLCHDYVADNLIGSKGSVIGALQNESGASMVFSSPMDDCQERVITVTASEDLDSCYSAAQHAILYVFRKSLELDSSRKNVQARLLVKQPFIVCLSGHRGQTVSQIKQSTGSSILIMGGDHVPKCAAKDDVVVQISGDFINVLIAIFQVTTKLRDSLVQSVALNGGALRIQPSSTYPDISTNGTENGIVSSGYLKTSVYFPDLSKEASILESIEQLRLSPQNDNSSLPKAEDETKTPVITENRASFTTSGGDTELTSANRSAIVKKTTMEIEVPQKLIASIFNEDENNLENMKQISGAKLEVYQSNDENGEGEVVVSGTPNQTMSAQNLLQAFILARQ